MAESSERQTNERLRELLARAGPGVRCARAPRRPRRQTNERLRELLARARPPAAAMDDRDRDLEIEARMNAEVAAACANLGLDYEALCDSQPRFGEPLKNRFRYCYLEEDFAGLEDCVRDGFMDSEEFARFRSTYTGVKCTNLEDAAARRAELRQRLFLFDSCM